MKLTSSKPKKPAAAVAAKPATPAKPVRPKKRGGSSAVVVTSIVAAVLLVAVIGGLLYVGSLDTIFPNVYVDGVPLGGMSEEAAASVLRSSGYEAGADNVRAEIGLPNDTTLVVTGEEVGMRLDAVEAAKRAYYVGRDENIFVAGYKYVAGLFGAKTELDVGDIGAPDETVIRDKAQPLVSSINDELAGSTYEMTSTAIELYKGAGGVLANLNDVCDLVIDTLTRSLRDKTPAVAEYELPEDTTDGGVDFNALYASIHKDPVSSKYDPETLDVTESVIGVSFDVSIARALYASAVTGELVRVPLIFTEPEVTSEDLASLIFRDVLSESKTYIDGSSNRVNNVKLAASSINGYVLNPGDTFSYNEVVGERTTAKGYLTAGAYAGGRTVQEVGGGICQVSSTLYDCTLYADLEVVDRRNHQFVVSYLPLGNDATVNWGTTDYKFKNDTDYPIRIEIETEGRNMTARLVGTKLTTNTIKIEYVVLSKTDYKTVETEHESIPEGTTKVDNNGSNGYTVETYKYRYDEHGTLLDKEYVAKSVYNAQTKIILVPIGALTSESPDPGTQSPTPSPEESTDPGTQSPEPQESPTPTPPPSAEPTETPPGTTTDEPSPAATPNDESDLNTDPAP